MKKYFLIILSIVLLTVFASSEKKGTINFVGYLSEYDSTTNSFYSLKIPKQSIYNFLPYVQKYNYYKDSIYQIYDYVYSPLYKDYYNLESIGYTNNGWSNVTKGNEILIDYLKKYYYTNIAPQQDTDHIKILDTLLLNKTYNILQNTLPSNSIIKMDFGDISEPAYHNFLFYAYNYLSSKDSLEKVFLRKKIQYYLIHIKKLENRLFADVYSGLLVENFNPADLSQIFIKPDSIFDKQIEKYDSKIWIDYYYLKGLIYNHLGQNYPAQNNYLLALNNLDKTITNLSNEDKLLLKSKINYSLFDIYSIYSGYNESFYIKSNEIISFNEKNSNEHSIQLTNVNLIYESELLLSRIRNMPYNEISFLENSCILLRNIKYINPVFRSKLYNNIGSYFYQKGETKWALFYHLEALALYLENNTNIQSQDYTIVLSNLTKDYGQLKDFTNSNRYNSLLGRISYYTNSPGYYQYEADDNYINNLLIYADTNKAILEIHNKIDRLNYYLANNTIHPFNYQESLKSYYKRLETIYANKSQYDSAYKYSLSANSFLDLTSEYTSLATGEISFYRDRDNHYNTLIINQKTRELEIKQKEAEILKLKEEKSTAEKQKLENENAIKNIFIDSLKLRDSIKNILNDSIKNLNKALLQTNQTLKIANNNLKIKYRNTKKIQLALFILSSILIIATWLFLRFLSNKYNIASRENKINLDKLENELSKAQIELNRSNLNPHFLKNLLQDLSYAINTENNKILLKEYNDDIMRLVNNVWLNSKEFDISVKEEFIILKKYFYLATKYYTTPIHFEINNNNLDVNSIRIPSLITLNILENSVKHAFPDTITNDRRNISVNLIKNNNRYEIQIKDTGKGFDIKEKNNGINIVEEKINSYNKIKQQKSIKDSTKYNNISIDINSVLDKGTEIIIKI